MAVLSPLVAAIAFVCRVC